VNQAWRMAAGTRDGQQGSHPLFLELFWFENFDGQAVVFGGFAEHTDLGLVVGAIVAGMLMRPVFNASGDAGVQAAKAVRAVSYGFFGIIFFLWIGMSVDLSGILKAPELAILLFLSAFVGKIIGIFLMVPLGKINSRKHGRSV